MIIIVDIGADFDVYLYIVNAILNLSESPVVNVGRRILGCILNVYFYTLYRYKL